MTSEEMTAPPLIVGGYYMALDNDRFGAWTKDEVVELIDYNPYTVGFRCRSGVMDLARKSFRSSFVLLKTQGPVQ